MESKPYIQMKGVVFLFRYNSTGNPTKYHIIDDETNKTYCKWGYFTAQVFICEEEQYYKTDICQKCLKKYNNDRTRKEFRNH